MYEHITLGRANVTLSRSGLYRVAFATAREPHIAAWVKTAKNYEEFRCFCAFAGLTPVPSKDEIPKEYDARICTGTLTGVTSRGRRRR